MTAGAVVAVGVVVPAQTAKIEPRSCAICRSCALPKHCRPYKLVSGRLVNAPAAVVTGVVVVAGAKVVTEAAVVAP